MSGEEYRQNERKHLLPARQPNKSIAPYIIFSESGIFVAGVHQVDIFLSFVVFHKLLTLYFFTFLRRLGFYKKFIAAPRVVH